MKSPDPALTNQITPPAVDDETTRTARLLHILLLIMIVSSLIAVIGLAVFAPDQFPLALSEGLFPFVLALIALGLLRRGQVKTTGWLLVISIWILALRLTISGGVDRADIVIFDLPVLLAFFLLGRRSGGIVLIVTMLTSAGLLWADLTTDLLPEALAAEDLSLTWLIQSIILVAISWLYSVTTANIQGTLERLRNQERLLKTRNQELYEQIGEREQAEEAYRLVAENSVQGLIILQDGRGAFSNQAFADITGYTIDQLLAFDDGVAGVIYPDDQAFVRERVRARLAGEDVPQHYDLRILRKDGTIRWCELFAVAITYHGRPAIQATFMDITDRTNAQDELRRSADLMRAVIDSVTNGIMVTDLQGNIIIYNQCYLELFDLPGSYTTASFEDRNRLLQGRLIDSDWLARRLAQGEQGPTFAGASVVETVDGRVLQTYSQPYVVGGKVAGRVFIYLDITEQRHAQAELERSVTLTRAVIESATNGILVLSNDNDIIIYNQSYLDLLNLPPEYVEKSFADRKLLFESRLKDNTWLNTWISKIASNPGLVGNETFELKDGRMLEVYMQPYIVEGKRAGRVYRYVDTTDRRQAAQKQLELALEQEKVELLRQFIGNVSHDLKTPLAIINTSLHLLGRTEDPHYRAEKLDVIGIQTKRLESLIQDLLTISRLEYASQIDFQPIQLGQVLTNVALAFRIQIESKRQSIDLDIDDTPPVMGNRGELHRALTNLIENAINYTPVGGQLGCHLKYDGDMVILTVTDTGIGIDPADLPHVFNRFYRSAQARSVLSTGSGLGLAIVKKVVDLHAGDITVESQLGVGTTFRIALPALHESVTA